MSEELYSVVWTKTALQDLQSIIRYISSHSNRQAKNIYVEIKEHVKDLRQLPFRGRVVPELQFFGVLIYRELIVKPWRIIYKLEGKNVWILAVIDGRRNVEDILFNRLV
ncbi:plasmid stabilization system [Dethiobacter alkaliphilus AHT 1]|uniref:Plasmid stabilization system n=2 Tax=Dethiobacter TaxID=427925 RepID=C0GCI5_DETAL|nr:plasmid stabilization system [Dethiobacter alkaliphilus AHT 1]